MPTEDEKKWMAAWRLAGPALEKIRNEELRSMDSSEGLRLLGANQLMASTEMNGLAIQQAWFMRLRVKQLMSGTKINDP